jgi:hypothetical protein
MKTQWQRYKELELLPDEAAKPQLIHSPLVTYLDQRWRSLLNQHAGKLDYECQVDYLERRLKLTCDRDIAGSVWEKLWGVLNQPLGFGQQSAKARPEIRQTLDQTGQTWWKVYDPLTGQTAFLESEAEVRLWLEARLYH